MRYAAAAAVLSDSTIAIFGGFCDGEQNDGYVLDIRTNSLTPILGKESDFKFVCYTTVQQIRSGQYVTVGRGADKMIHMLLLNVSPDGKQFETKSIHNYGKVKLIERASIAAIDDLYSFDPKGFQMALNRDGELGENLISSQEEPFIPFAMES